MMKLQSTIRRHLRLLPALACLLALLLPGAPAARAEDPLIPLEGSWKFKPGDDLAWAGPGLDDSGWASIQAPRPWGLQGYADVGSAWYRKSLRLEQWALDPEMRLGVRIGAVASAYELYAGGLFVGAVGKLPPEGRLEYDRHRVFPIPRRAISGNGTLTLALRVWRSPGTPRDTGGIVSKPLEAGPLDLLAQRQALSELPQLMLTLFYWTIGCHHLYLYLRRPRERAYLPLSLFILLNSFYILLTTQWRFVLGDHYEALKELEYLLVFTLPAAAIQSFWSLLDRPIGRRLRLYQLSHPLLGLLVAATPGLELNLHVLRWWSFWIIPAFLLGANMVFKEIRKGNPEARTIGYGGLILSLAWSHDFLMNLNLLPPPALNSFGFAGLVVTMSLSLGQRFERVHRQLDALSQNLQSRVLERTRQLELAKEAAEAASRAKSQFLANISHELRTPMNGIMGITSLLLQSPAPPQELESLKIIDASAKNLMQLLDDLLDFSKIEAGRLTLESHPFQLQELLWGVLALFRAKAAEQGVELSLQCEPGVPEWLLGDSLRLRQILLNLVGNAVKFTPRGEVLLSVTRLEKDRMRFEIRDTGIGIPAEAQQLLFLPFSQADASSARRFGGSGLGLVISRRLAELMQGRIGFHSVQGQGSLFWVELRLPPTQAPAPTESTPPAPDERRGQARILLVEDNHINRLVATRMLESRGYKIVPAGNGLEALEALEHSRYELILMDCQMPELDGYATTRELRRRELERGAARTPIIALTAHATAENRELCLQAGMDDYLSKPFSVQALLECLARWLPHPAPE